MVVKEIDGQLIEYPMAENIVHVTPKGITHILVPLDDAILTSGLEPFRFGAMPRRIRRVH